MNEEEIVNSDPENGSESNENDNQTQDSNTGNAVVNTQYWMLALQNMRQSPPPTGIVRELAGVSGKFSTIGDMPLKRYLPIKSDRVIGAFSPV